MTVIDADEEAATFSLELFPEIKTFFDSSSTMVP